MKLYLGCLLVTIGLVSLSSGTEKPPASTTCSCGWVNRGRIVGGKEAKKNEFPLMVSIQAKEMNMHVCGGTILTPHHVVTAAHCTFFITEDDIELIVGAHSFNNVTNEQKIQVAKIINHEQYDDDLNANDIAILVTKERIKFSQNVGPACFPTSRIDLTGKKITALGWGLTVYRGKPATTLQTVDLTVISHTNCTSMWANSKSAKRPRDETNICTYELCKDTCQGDSGGPLLWVDPEINRFTIVALVSFGGVCGGRRPAVNTDVAAYNNWVNNIIKTTYPEEKACTKA